VGTVTGAFSCQRAAGWGESRGLHRPAGSVGATTRRSAGEGFRLHTMLGSARALAPGGRGAANDIPAE